MTNDDEQALGDQLLAALGLSIRGHWSTRKPKLMGHLHQYGTEFLIVDDAHDLSLEHLMLLKEVTDQGKLQYDHPLELCLVAAGRGDTIPLKETFDLPDPTWLQFRRRFDKLQPFCRVASHTSDEVRTILATLEQVYQPLFPQLNMRQWTSSIYGWLTNPVLDPTHSGRVTMDNLMKLVMTALEWSYLAGDTEVKAERFKSAAELLVLRHDTLKLIDGAGPEALPQEQNQADVPGVNGKEPEQQAVEDIAVPNAPSTVETVETAKVQEVTGKTAGLHVLRRGSYRSATVYQQQHPPGGMPWLWKNAFACPGQGYPPVQSVSPTQAANPIDSKALVNHRKNRLGCGWGEMMVKDKERNLQVLCSTGAFTRSSDPHNHEAILRYTQEFVADGLDRAWGPSNDSPCGSTAPENECS
nr:hypothetical protein [Ktedonosporobacter rubrisoli]